MAEILIKAISVTNTDLVKDRRGCYKRGDPVVAVPDGHRWGRLETLPIFWRVRVSAPLFILREFCIPESEPGLWKSENNGPRTLTRRLYSVQPALLTPAMRAEMFLGGVPNLTFDQFKRCCVSKAARRDLIAA
jgi:hypothetical protein